jgi:hypothetical protein
MSVLSFPRIFFTGFMCWDPATGNNNDFFPTYDDEKVALNWDFFNQNKINITPSNFGTMFRNNGPGSWAINPQTIPGYSPGIPMEWNYFGGNGAYFVQYTDASQNIDRTSKITGGMLDYGKSVAGDPLVGTPVTILGDPFGNPEPKPPGRLVDNNPVSVNTSQIYFNSMQLGDANTGITAPRADRMQSRFINFTRNFNLGAAGGASVTWQTCFPAGSTLKINAGKSPLLQALQALIASGKAKGVMVRFNTYLNLYFQNGYFNNIKQRPISNDDLPALYYTALQNGDLFSNSCYSRVVGIVGPWYANELATCPEGRYLPRNDSIYLCNPRNTSPCWPSPIQVADAGKTSPTVHHTNLFKAAAHVAAQPAAAASIKNPINIPAPQLKGAAQLGLAVAEVNQDAKSKAYYLSLDLLNTFPEWYWQGDKVDFKDIIVGVPNGGGVTQVGKLSYAQYNQQAYEGAGGTVDLPLSDSQAQLVRSNPLAFSAPDTWVAVQNSDGSFSKATTTVVTLEQPLTAQTDQRSMYLNVGETTTFTISVKNLGVPAAGVNVLILKYNQPDALPGPTDAIPQSAKNQVVNFSNGTPTVVTVTTDAGQQLQTSATVLQSDQNGNVTVEIAAAGRGFPSLVFYPYLAGQQQPVPPGSFDEIDVGMFATVRVFANDDTFVDQFVNLWNSPSPPGKPYDPANAWNFVYNNILYLYDMIFPVMLKFVPLGDRARVEGAIDQVLTLIAPSYFDESTLAMPITRDLSEGMRTVLQLWGGLVKKNYPPQPISKPSPPVA